MIKIKLHKTSLVNLVQMLAIITFFIIGFNFKSEAAALPSTVLGMLTKVQSTNDLQNFVWLFTHNITLMFVVFWLSYFSFGAVGTIWCIGNAFMAGVLANLYLNIIKHPWLSILFIALEFAAEIVITISSTYLRFKKFNLKKANNDKIYSAENYAKYKKKYEKNILFVYAIIAIILLIAAILESVVLSSI